MRKTVVRTGFLWIFGFSFILLSACSKHSESALSVNHLTFHTLTGEQITLSDRAHPTFINFWSTSCAVCIHELPELALLYNEYRPQGFELIAVAMPYDPPNRVLELAEAQDYPFPVALDVKGEAVDAFTSVVGTPTSYLLDGEGKLVKRYVGAVDLAELRTQLNRLLENS